MSDHGIFRENGVPYLFLSCGRWPHYHRDTDTLAFGPLWEPILRRCGLDAISTRRQMDRLVAALVSLGVP